MPWRTLTATDVTSRMTQFEQAMITNSSGVQNLLLTTRLTDAINTFNSCLIAVGNSVVTGQVVDRYRNQVMAYAVGEWLKDQPLNSGIAKVFWTDARKDAYKEAQQTLDKISTRQAGAIEDPSGFSRVQSWNSDQFIVGRMAYPPPPLLQLNQLGNPYPAQANPNSRSIAVQLVAPSAPVNFTAFPSSQVAGQITIWWILPPGAFATIIYRGTASGQENFTVPLATVLNLNTYTDTTCVIGTPYFYTAACANQTGSSPNAVEVTATPIATLAPPNPFWEPQYA